MDSKVSALLDATSTAIQKCFIPSVKAGSANYLRIATSGFVLKQHKLMLSNRLVNTICNCFLDNRWKRSIESVVQDRVASFEKCLRDKISFVEMSLTIIYQEPYSPRVCVYINLNVLEQLLNNIKKHCN